jgi:hypothetical protein
MMSFERHGIHFSVAKRCEKTDPLRAIGHFCCSIKPCKRLFQQAGSFVVTKRDTTHACSASLPLCHFPILLESCSIAFSTARRFFHFTRLRIVIPSLRSHIGGNLRLWLKGCGPHERSIDGIIEFAICPYSPCRSTCTIGHEMFVNWSRPIAEALHCCPLIFCFSQAFIVLTRLKHHR